MIYGLSYRVKGVTLRALTLVYIIGIGSTEDTMGVRTTMLAAEFGPSSIIHTGPRIDVSDPQQELEL